MKQLVKPFLYVVVVLAVLAAIWFGGGTGGQGEYRVEIADHGRPRLTLVIAKPGLFEDLRFGPVLGAEAGGRPALWMKPWPGERVRVFSLYRGPLVLTLAEGAGPFRVSALPFPVGSERPEVEFPAGGPHAELLAGWRQVGDYVGPLTVVESGGVRVAVPEGVPNPQATADQVATLFKAGTKLVTVPAMKEPLIVAPNADPLAQAGAVMDHLLPAYGKELAWWRDGLREYGVLRLMDQTKLWTNIAHEKWLRDPARSDGLRLVIWLDMSLKAQEHKSVDDLLRATYAVKSQTEFVSKLKEFSNLAIADKLDRMLKGREPMPGMTGK